MESPPGSASEPQSERDYLPLDRFNAFSDGVFAIAITLLVLELSVPSLSIPLWKALLEQWPEFLGYLLSFAFIGGNWLSHSGMTKLMKRGDNVTYGLNLLVLLFVALLPFSTKLLVANMSSSDVSAAVFLYGLNVLLDSFLLSLLMFYIAREPTLVVDNVADETLKKMTRQRWYVVGATSIAVGVALISPYVAVALYVVVSVLFLGLPLFSMRRRRA